MVIIEFGKAEQLTLDTNSLFIRFVGPDFKDNVDKIKKFWNRKYLKESKEWEVPFSCWEEIKELYANTYIKYINEPPKAKFVTDDDILNGLDFNGFNLYDYQLEGVKFGLNHHNFLLLDEQGLGKTVQLLTLARYKKQHRNLKHCLIICGLNSLKFNWVKEVHKFCKDEDAIVLGTKTNSKGKIVNMSVEDTKNQIKSCPNEFFWIINIEKIRLSDEDNKNKTGIVNYFNEQIELGNLGMVVCDEIHKCKNSQSQQGKGLMAFDSKADRIGMTGTLLVNNPYDLYVPMLFTGLINYTKWVFENKFVIKDDWGKPIGYQNMNELHEILYKSSLRRTKDLLDLPPKLYKQEWLEFSPEEQSVFDAVIGNGNLALLDKIEPPFDMFAKLTRMRQATTVCELLSSKCKYSTKFERLKDILEEAKLNNQKVLVFCQFTEALKLGLKYCAEYNPKLVCGGMGAKVQETIDEHENCGGFSVMFAQEATLGAGFTLTNTEICVFLTPPWNKATYDQCCDRIHRIGQKKTVQIIDLLIENSYDELIYLKLHGKGALSDALIDGKVTPEVKEALKKVGIEFNEGEPIELSKLF